MKDVLEAAARRAAEAWATQVEAVELIAMSENAVFRVDSVDSGRFVLRIHRPGYNSLAEMQSEVAWVEALRAGAIETAVPRPALDGAFYVPVELDDGPTRYAGAVEWLAGSPLEDALEADPASAPVLYRQLGRIAGGIRAHSESWEVPAGFARRRWDADAFVGPDPLWGRFWESPALNAQQQDVLIAARDRLREQLGSLPVDRTRFGMIHADFHANNVMITSDRHSGSQRSVAIDFDDAGFGWYIHEVAVALYRAHETDSYQAARDALLSGYREVHPLGEDEVDLLETFFTVRALMVVGWLTARPEVAGYMHLPGIVHAAVLQAERYLSTTL